MNQIVAFLTKKNTRTSNLNLRAIVYKKWINGNKFTPVENRFKAQNRRFVPSHLRIKPKH